MNSMIALIWLAEFCSKISIICIIGVFCCIAAVPISMMIEIGLIYNEELQLVKKVFKKALFSLIFFVTLFALVPSSKTAYTMLSIHLGQEMLKEPNTQNLLGKTYKVLEYKLDEILNEECKEKQ